MPATIAFFPEGAYGPTNNCAGIAAVLRERGHRVVFIVEESFAGTLEARGFEERLVRLGPPPEHEEAPGQFWKDYIRATAPVFRKPTIEQLEAFIAPTFQALLDGARFADERLGEIIDDLDADVVVEDNVVAFPALSRSGRPWVRIVSCNPAELKDELVPPTFSGYPTTSRGSEWDEYWAEYQRVIGPLHAEHHDFCVDRGAPPLPDLELIGTSPWLNLYLYPSELDYRRSKHPVGRWSALESCVRDFEAPWRLPDRDSTESDERRPLVYLSLGSLGSADVDLMQRLIDTLADHEAIEVVVSLGPQHERLEVPVHVHAREFLPQTSILDQASAVITHGGNNTVTECLHFGCPMIVLPLFWDQYDNAQRVQETGFGLRLDTYRHEPAQLIGALDELLSDEAMHRRAAGVAARLSRDPGTARAADAIETVVGGLLAPVDLALS
jgi:UDP:flavonoid glycosyltransferase YjiC (YdhE family)